MTYLAHGQLLKYFDVTVPSGSILRIFIIKRGFCLDNLIPDTNPAWTNNAFSSFDDIYHGNEYNHFNSGFAKFDAIL